MSHPPAPAPGWACAGLALALLLLSAALHGATPANEVPRKPLTGAEVLAASTAADWRALDPSNTLYLELPSGRVVIDGGAKALLASQLHATLGGKQCFSREPH